MFIERIITKIGYLETTLPYVYFNQLIQNIKNNPPLEAYNQNLAGQIENEKFLDSNLIPKEIQAIIVKGCYDYLNIFGHNILKDVRFTDKKYTLKLLSSWINYQKAGEYNPIHDHDGHLVFVIWVKIPYNINDELNHFSCVNSNNRISSKFQFSDQFNWLTHYDDSVIHVDKTYEGKMVIFHNSMKHTVYPFFTSDEYRISISGNLDIVFDA